MQTYVIKILTFQYVAVEAESIAVAAAIAKETVAKIPEAQLHSIIRTDNLPPKEAA